jgi:hypothetical protein
MAMPGSRHPQSCSINLEVRLSISAAGRRGSLSLEPVTQVTQMLQTCDAALACYRVDILSPGRAVLRDLRAVARGLARPVAEVAAAAYQAPSVLADGLDRAGAERLAELLAEVGLVVQVAGEGEELPAAELFDVAAWVLEPAGVEAISEGLAAFLGITAEQAYVLLATPPGVIVGRVGAAAVEALAERLGPGVALSVARCEQGCFDLLVEPDAAVPPRLAEVLARAGLRTATGLVALGLDHDEAASLWPQLRGRSDVRLIHRALVRYDVVLTHRTPATPERRAALTSLFGVPAAAAAKVLAAAPVALAEGCSWEEACRLAAAAAGAGLELACEPAGFGRAGLQVESARDLGALRAALGGLGLPMPSRLPAQVAGNLSDLEARRLASVLDAAGARTRYTKPVPAGSEA